MKIELFEFLKQRQQKQQNLLEAGQAILKEIKIVKDDLKLSESINVSSLHLI